MKKICKWVTIGLGVTLGLVYLISIPLVRNYISNALFARVQNEKAYEMLMDQEGIVEIAIETSAGKCRGFQYEGENPHDTTIVYFYGATQCAEEVMLVREGICNPTGLEKCNLIVLDYPGNGRSAGRYDEKNMKKMMLEAYDKLLEQEELKEQQVILYGYSMGTGIANYVASKRTVDGLILIAPYCNGYDLFNGLIDIFHGLFRVYVPLRMNAEQFAKDIDIVPLIVSSVDDEMVPHETSKRLAQNYPLGVQFHVVHGVRHAEYARDEVYDVVHEYMEKIWEK